MEEDEADEGYFFRSRSETQRVPRFLDAVKLVRYFFIDRKYQLRRRAWDSGMISLVAIHSSLLLLVILPSNIFC